MSTSAKLLYHPCQRKWAYSLPIVSKSIKMMCVLFSAAFGFVAAEDSVGISSGSAGPGFYNSTHYQVISSNKTPSCPCSTAVNDGTCGCLWGGGLTDPSLSELL